MYAAIVKKQKYIGNSVLWTEERRITMNFDGKKENYPQDVKVKGTEQIGETSFAYVTEKKQKYTLEDYYRLPDEQRVELIDGVFYDMAAPTTMHQIIGAKIFRGIADYIEKKKGRCVPFMAPVDVQLDCDEYTMVQPDVLVVCDRDKIIRRCIYGAPDLIVEVLSPSTRWKDMSLKLRKYQNAGVREYWIVDLEKKRVLVYEFGKNGRDEAEEQQEENDRSRIVGETEGEEKLQEVHPQLYSMEDWVPVGIFGGECRIDFSEVYEAVRFILEK